MIFTPTRIAALYNSHLAPKLHRNLQSKPLPKKSSPSQWLLFDETLARRLRSLPPIPNQNPNPSPPIPLLSLAALFDLLAATIADADALISDPSLAGDSDALLAYLDAGVPLLDACNAISAEIARIERRFLPLRLALHHLGEDRRSPPISPEKSRRAREAIAEWEALRSKQTGIDADSIGRSRGVGAPRGGTSAVGKALCAVEAVSVVAVTVAVAALGGGFEGIRVSGEGAWGEAVRGVVEAVAGGVGAECGGEVAAVERLVAAAAADGGDVAVVVERVEAVREGLDAVTRSVNCVFRAAIGIRSRALDNLRRSL